MTKHIFALALACAGALLPTVASAQSAAIAKLLTKADEIYTDKGYSPLNWSKTGSISNGKSLEFTITLKTGSFSVIGVCDNDCSDLDIEILDASGDEVGRDTEEDDFPIVTLEVPSLQTYRVKLTMAACAANPCELAAKAYSMN